MNIEKDRRLVQLDGAINVRDMGGYRTSDGKSKIIWGKLFRGDQLNNLTEKDIQILEEKDIQTIIDYRSDDERKFRPNKFIKSIENTIICNPNSVMSEAAGQAVDIKTENVMLVKALENNEIPIEEIEDSSMKIKQNYRKMVTEEISIKAFSKMLKVLTCPYVGNSLQHCRGGKDRTGVGCALLLRILGIEEESIYLDYELTDEVRKDRNQTKMTEYKELTTNKQHLKYLEMLISTKREFLEASFLEITQKFGSFDCFVKNELMLTQEEINKLKDKYLEEV